MVEALAFQEYEHERKEVKKLKDGSISFPVTHQTAVGLMEFDFRIKKNKEGKVIIENKTPITEKNKGYVHNKEKRYFLKTNTPSIFAKSLWAVLDIYIGKGRKSVDSEKWGKAYKLLGEHNQNLEIQKQNELTKIKTELHALQNELPKKFNRDPQKKTLKVEYNIGYGFEEKVLYTEFKQEGDKVVFTLSSGYLRTFAKLTSKKIIFNQHNLGAQVEAYLNKTFATPLTYKKLIGKDTQYTLREEVQKKAIKKARDAAEIFLRYSKEKK